MRIFRQHDCSRLLDPIPINVDNPNTIGRLVPSEGRRELVVRSNHEGVDLPQFGVDGKTANTVKVNIK